MSSDGRRSTYRLRGPPQLRAGARRLQVRPGYHVGLLGRAPPDQRSDRARRREGHVEQRNRKIAVGERVVPDRRRIRLGRVHQVYQSLTGELEEQIGVAPGHPDLHYTRPPSSNILLRISFGHILDAVRSVFLQESEKFLNYLGRIRFEDGLKMRLLRFI